MDSKDSNKAFVEIILEIRKRHIDSKAINVNDISQLLIGLDIE
jgi:hypothetical protein